MSDYDELRRAREERDELRRKIDALEKQRDAERAARQRKDDRALLAAELKERGYDEAQARLLSLGALDEVAFARTTDGSLDRRSLAANLDSWLSRDGANLIGEQPSPQDSNAERRARVAAAEQTIFRALTERGHGPVAGQASDAKRAAMDELQRSIPQIFMGERDD